MPLGYPEQTLLIRHSLWRLYTVEQTLLMERSLLRLATPRVPATQEVCLLACHGTEAPGGHLQGRKLTNIRTQTPPVS